MHFEPSAWSPRRGELRAGTILPSRDFHLTPHTISSADFISPARFHLASCRFHLPHPPASGRHLESRALRICHLVHLVHLIYPIPSHLGLGRAPRPSHLPSCHLKTEIEIWMFTSFPGRASPQG